MFNLNLMENKKSWSQWDEMHQPKVDFMHTGPYNADFPDIASFVINSANMNTAKDEKANRTNRPVLVHLDFTISKYIPVQMANPKDE